MIYDPLFQAIVAGTLVALGIASEHMRIRYVMWRKRQRRFTSSYRKDPEPQMARWTAAHGRESWR